MYKVIIIGVIITFLAIFAFTVIDPNVINPGASQASSQVVNEGFYSITVTGQVIKPGVFVLSEGATIEDLLMAAGGPSENADAKAYIESTVLKKGQSYYIAPLYSDDDICGDVELAKVNINSDSKDKLMSINGFGSTIVTALINYRSQNGSFTYLEELKAVSGIGNSTFEKVKNYITLR